MLRAALSPEDFRTCCSTDWTVGITPSPTGCGSLFGPWYRMKHRVDTWSSVERYRGPQSTPDRARHPF